MCFDPHRGMQTETVAVSVQRLARGGLARHRAPELERLLHSEGAEGDAVGAGCCLRWPQRPRLLAVGIRLGQLGRAHVLDQHASAREHLHEPGKDGLQQRVQFLVGGRAGFDGAKHDIGTAVVHAVQHQAVQMDVEVGGRAEALYQRDGAAVGLGCLGTRLTAQVAGDDAVHHLQQKPHHLGLRCEQ